MTLKRSWASQKFGWFPSESHPIGLSFGKNLCCLFSTKLALLSLQKIFCSPAVWFGASVVVIVGLTYLKLSLPQWELTKHRNLVTWSQYSAEGKWCQFQPTSCSSASISETTLMHPFIYRKQTFPVCVSTALLKSFHCHANNPPKHKKQWTHPDKISGCNMSSFIHIWSLFESVAQEKLGVGNETSISEKGRRQERSWFSDFWHYCTKPGKR